MDLNEAQKKLADFRKNRKMVQREASMSVSDASSVEDQSLPTRTLEEVPDSGPGFSRTFELYMPACVQQLGVSLAQHSFVLIMLKICLFVLLQVIFVRLEFGAPFFVIAALFFVWTSMRSGSRNKDEPSAYSVFNPNCERLLGQLTAEQFENEIRRGGI